MRGSVAPTLGCLLVGTLAGGEGSLAQAVAVGGEFQVNSYTTNGQTLPAVAVDGSGDFVVVWTSYGSSGDDASGFSIQGQTYTAGIFSDGFESGNTSAWSSVVP
jgi:hypothetical protein